MPVQEASFIEKKSIAFPLIKQVYQFIQLYRSEDISGPKLKESIEYIFGSEICDAYLADLLSKMPQHCKCWMSLNTGPNGECEVCGLIPSPERFKGDGG